MELTSVWEKSHSGLAFEWGNPIIKILKLPSRGIPRIGIWHSRVGEISSRNMDGTIEENCRGFIRPQVQMRRARRLVFVLWGGQGIPSVEHQIGALRGRIPCNVVGTPSGRNPTAAGFDSHRMAEKEPVGMSVLMPPSGEILSVECTDRILWMREILAAEESCSRFTGKNLISGACGWINYNGWVYCHGWMYCWLKNESSENYRLALG